MGGVRIDHPANTVDAAVGHLLYRIIEGFKRVLEKKEWSGIQKIREEFKREWIYSIDD